MTAPTTRVTEAPLTFRAQLAVLWRYKHLIVLVVVLGVLGALALAVLPSNRYTSTADVLVRVASASPIQSGDVTKLISMQTEIEVAESQRVAQEVVKATGRDESEAAELTHSLRVTNPPDTTILRFSFTDPDPQTAARYANEFVKAYLADREARTLRVVNDQAKVLNEESATLNSQLKQLDRDNSLTAAEQTRRSLLQEQIVGIQSRLVDVIAGGCRGRCAELPARIHR